MLNDKNEVLHKHESAIECILHHQPKRNILFDTLLYLKQSHHKSIIKKHIDYFLTPSENLTQFISNHFKKEGKTLANPILIKQNKNSNSEGNYIVFDTTNFPKNRVYKLLFLIERNGFEDYFEDDLTFEIRSNGVRVD